MCYKTSLQILIVLCLASTVPAVAQVSEMPGSSADIRMWSSHIDSLQARGTRTVEALSASDSSWSWHRGVEEEGWTEERARRAAKVDPDILIYMKPSAGTRMQRVEIPEMIDPKMVRPTGGDSTATSPSQTN